MGVVRHDRARVETTAPAPAAGDRFSDSVATCLPDLWRFAVSLVGPELADDLVQDALARAWVKRDQFDPDRGSAKAWLFAIMADRARRRRGPRIGPRVDVRLSPHAAAAEPDPARVDVRRAVDGLPKRQRLAVTLHYYLDLPVVEVAELMGCSVGTVKPTLHDARRNLTERVGGTYA